MKKAFTLSEVLITLGIIGVVAALTLPGLINSLQKRELQIALKKNYSVISQAFMAMEQDLGENIDGSSYPVYTFFPEFKKYFKTVRDCNRRDCVPQEGSNYKNFSKSANINQYYLDDGQIVLTDGSLILIENPAAVDQQRVWISVDINGYKKPPNAWGHDLFTFQVTSSGKLLPMGAEGTMYTDLSTYCSKDSAGNMNGIACTAKALEDPDYFKNLP
ncbi:MAG: type II secretion system GspH family protein [Heliobacteriaceae bacterium]|nr:type II secretion system GspH family protein [Heliobacteriaceae bacterium]